MNDQRRRALTKANRSLRKGIREDLDTAREVIEIIASDEEDARGAMPESLCDTDRYYTSEDASEAMDEAISCLDEAESYFDDDKIEDAKKAMLSAVDALCQIIGVH